MPKRIFTIHRVRTLYPPSGDCHRTRYPQTRPQAVLHLAAAIQHAGNRTPSALENGIR